MIDIRGLIQTALDTALFDAGVYSYWLRKTESTGQSENEYIVYTLNGDSDEDFADDIPIVKNATATVKYYYHDSLLDAHSGREQVKERAEVILLSLLESGFNCPNGYFDAGDVDSIGFGTMVFECEYWRVV